MSYDLRQFRDLIERTLEDLDPEMASGAAVRLLLGTAAVESDFGTFLRQRGGGPALGAFQIEPGTFNWLKSRYHDRYMLTHRSFEECEWNLGLAIIMARLKYRSIPKPLPHPEGITGLAAYWKQFYNTELGSGTEEQFIRKYHQYVEEDE